MNRLRPHLTYANVTATLALFIAISGAGAYAASQIPRKSVGAPQLRLGAVTVNKLRKNAVTTPKIKAKAITTPKLGSSVVDGRVLASGSVSSEKIAFGAITNEKVGPEAISGDQIVESSLTKVPSASFADAATSAESAQPVAFAEVDADGTLISNSSKGLGPADVARTGDGAYCIAVAGFIPRGAQVTAKNTNTAPVIANVAIPGSCGFPKIEVHTYNPATALRADRRSIQTWGVEASSTERAEVTALVQAFLNARAAADWAKACSHLAARQRAEFERLFKGPKARHRRLRGDDKSLRPGSASERLRPRG